MVENLNQIQTRYLLQTGTLEQRLAVQALGDEVQTFLKTAYDSAKATRAGGEASDVFLKASLYDALTQKYPGMDAAVAQLEVKTFLHPEHL